jgi:hypothetical protein
VLIVRRFLLLSAVVAVVTLAMVYGPAHYPWTPGSERASRHEPFQGGALDPDGDDMASIRQAYAEASDLYRQGRYIEADARFQAAARGSSEMLAARTAYHRGNCLLAGARQGRVDPDSLARAERLYQDCLSRQAKVQGAEALFEGARFNLELTRLLLAQSKHPAAPGVARERGVNSTPPAIAKRATPAPQIVVRGEHGPNARPAPAGTSEPARREKTGPEGSNVWVPPVAATQAEDVMVGPDGVTIRRVPDGDASKK